MGHDSKVSLPVIKRLPKYYRYLQTLHDSNVTNISSRELAAHLGTTASQVRQDFNCFGDVNGRQGIGYNVDTLLALLESLLVGEGNDLIPAILVGAGRLGKAVSRFISRDTNGYKLTAVFDADPAEVGSRIGDTDIEIRNVDSLVEFCSQNHPRVAVLCVPRESAKLLTEQLVDLGIEAFWNFSHYDMSVDYPDILVENVHLGDSLMSLGYRLRNDNY